MTKHIVNYFLVVLTALFIFACEKEGGLPPRKYAGDYIFMKVTNRWNENTSSTWDTTYSEGFVKVDRKNDNAVIIHLGEDDYGTSGFNETFSAELELTEGNRTRFRIISGSPSLNGYFVSTDSLFVRNSFGGRGGGTVWSYYGSKTR